MRIGPHRGDFKLAPSPGLTLPYATREFAREMAYEVRKLLAVRRYQARSDRT